MNEWFVFQAFLHPYLQRLHNNITQPSPVPRVGAQQVVFFLPLDNRLGPQAVPFSLGVSISVRPHSLSLAPDATGGERRGRGGCSGEPAPGLRKKRVPRGQPAGQRRRRPAGSCLSLAVLLSAEVCLSPAARGGGPPCLVSGGGHSGDATVTKKQSASGSRSAHVRGPTGAPRDRAPGLGVREGPGWV